MTLRTAGAIFFTAVLFVAATSAQTFAIGGTVVEKNTNKPLSNAVVSIAPVGQPVSPSSFRTGQDGRFVFTQLPPGKYSLTAERRGFIRQSFREYQNYSTAIVVGPGLDSTNIVFPLSAGGAIRGTVIDQDNDPVRQAQVLLFRKEVTSGAWHISMRGQRQTDSSGQFRFPHVKPGTYFIGIQAHPWYAQHLPTQALATPEQAGVNEELDRVYPFTYYPDVTDPSSASPVLVNEAATSDIQIVLRAIPALHVQLSGGPSIPISRMAPTVEQVLLGGVQWGAYSSVSLASSGLELLGIAPGRYILSQTETAGPAQSTTRRLLDLTRSETLDIGALGKNSVTGRISFQGDPPSHCNPAVLLESIESQAQSSISVNHENLLNEPQGSFLIPGRYQLGLQNCPGFYLKSIEANGTAITTGELEIPSTGSIQLSLMAAKGLSNIDGIAVKDGNPVAGAMVLLIPKDFLRKDFIRRDQSDSDGTFTLADVAPGRYILLAIDDGRDLLYQDPGVMKPYLSQGQEIVAPLSSGTPVKATVLQRQQPAN